MKFGFLKPDYWSGYHFFGSFVLAHLCIVFWGWIGFPIAFGLGVLYEIFEAFIGWRLNWYYPWGLRMFDKRGGDFGDILFDFGGVVLAIFI